VTPESFSARVLANWSRGCFCFSCFCLLAAHLHSQTARAGGPENLLRPTVGKPSSRFRNTLVASLGGVPGIIATQEQALPGDSSSDSPPARAARVSYLRGNVSFLRAGLDQWTQAAPNFPVITGDRIYTDKDSRAEIEVGPYTVRMSDRTDLTVTNLNDQTVQLGLEQGSLRVSVYQLPTDDTVEVDTPNAALTFQRPGTYRADVDPDGDHTRVAVNRGSVEVSGGGASQIVEAGQAASMVRPDPLAIESVPIPVPDSFDRWSEERDRRIESSKSTQYVSPATPGYDDLDEYGRWEVDADYGPIWYPPVAVGWIPYRFGHWAWIDPWGWTWLEDEPWGFCPFHYGRWVHIGIAWGWLPGPIVALPVYAPALVAFLGGPGFSIAVGVGLVGWFPLGPGEPFFPWYHYGGDYLRIVNITNIRNVTNIRNITNITSINNVHYAYKTIATTAVPKNVLSNGEPVAKQAVRVPPEKLSQAQVVPHPVANPTPRAAVPGKPVSSPPVRSHPLASPAGPRPSSASPRAGAMAPARPGTMTPPRSATAAPARQTPPRFVTRSAPPPPPVPFAQRRGEMAEHPGRPLEPAQIDDLRIGRPVGPMRDREFPPHPSPVIRERAAPPLRPARPH
jgi:hypothetical protein